MTAAPSADLQPAIPPERPPAGAKRGLRRHRIAWLAILMLPVAMADLLFAQNESGQPQTGLMEMQAVFTTAGGPVPVTLEVARTAEEQRVGMMWRTETAPDRGMIFLNEVPHYPSFWMKNTLIPLDMIFIGEDRHIVHIHANAKPHDLTGIAPPIPAVDVIELGGGRAAAIGLKPGDSVAYGAITPPPAQ